MPAQGAVMLAILAPVSAPPRQPRVCNSEGCQRFPPRLAVRVRVDLRWSCCKLAAVRGRKAGVLGAPHDKSKVPVERQERVIQMTMLGKIGRDANRLPLGAGNHLDAVDPLIAPPPALDPVESNQVITRKLENNAADMEAGPLRSC